PAYERDYKQYEHLPQPRIVASKLRVDIHPQRGHATFKGTLDLVNKTAEPIPAVHLMLSDELEVRELRFDRPSELEHDDPRVRYQIHRLAEPLAPGATLVLHYDLGYLRDGFGNSGRDTAIVDNGSFLHSNRYIPSVGYSRD